MASQAMKVKHLHRVGNRPVAVVNADGQDHEMPLVPGTRIAGDLRDATYTKPDGNIGRVYNDYHGGVLPDWLHSLIDHSNAPGNKTTRQIQIPGMP